VQNRYRIIISCCLLIGATVLLEQRVEEEKPQLHRRLSSLPTTIAEWRGDQGVALNARIHDRLQFSDYLNRRYVDSTGRFLWLYIGYWESQRRGAVPHSPKHCLPEDGWNPIEARRITFPLAPGTTPVAVNRYVVQKDEQRYLVLYWYLSQNQPVADETFYRLLLVKNALLSNRTDGALIRITSPLYGTVEETFAYQVKYVQTMYPFLKILLPE